MFKKILVFLYLRVSRAHISTYYAICWIEIDISVDYPLLLSNIIGYLYVMTANDVVYESRII